MRIKLIVEGQDDVDFIRFCLEPRLREYEIDSIVPLCGSKIFLHSQKHVDQQINNFSVEKVFILVDQHSYPCKTYVLDKFVGDLNSRANVKIIVIVKEITAWFLADFATIEWINKGSLRALKKSTIRENTETIREPKEVFISLKGKKMKTRHAFKAKIGERYDFAKSRNRSPSFDRLLNELGL